VQSHKLLEAAGAAPRNAAQDSNSERESRLAVTKPADLSLDGPQGVETVCGCRRSTVEQPTSGARPTWLFAKQDIFDGRRVFRPAEDGQFHARRFFFI